MRIRDLGLIDYTPAFALQAEAAALAVETGRETLFLLEHTPVITFGRNGGEEHLPFGRAFFEERGVHLVTSTRGGSITCHFPGQLVAYPIMRIDKRPGGLRRFFSDMEEAVISTLARCGLEAGRSEGRPGVWVEGRKICSTGIAVKQWVSRHGLALNVARDLSLFDLVTPCGLPGVAATSVQRELDSERVGIQEVKALFREEFCRVFGVTEEA